MSQKKHSQLGMNAGTASHRLVKDVLFAMVQTSGHVCFHCGKPLTRDTFSIEHKIPWLDSEDPVKLFFDLNNIAFSHQSCNISAARRPNKIYPNAFARNQARYKRRGYSPEKRKQQYLRTGK